VPGSWPSQVPCDEFAGLSLPLPSRGVSPRRGEGTASLWAVTCTQSAALQCRDSLALLVMSEYPLLGVATSALGLRTEEVAWSRGACSGDRLERAE